MGIIKRLVRQIFTLISRFMIQGTKCRRIFKVYAKDTDLRHMVYRITRQRVGLFDRLFSLCGIFELKWIDSPSLR